MVIVSIPIIDAIDIHLATVRDDDLGSALRLDVLMEFAHIHSMEITRSLSFMLLWYVFDNFYMFQPINLERATNQYQSGPKEEDLITPGQPGNPRQVSSPKATPRASTAQVFGNMS